MYTGITQGLFPVISVKKTNNCIFYRVKLNKDLCQNLIIGASVAIDGVCQTVVALDDYTVEFHAAGKTLEITTLKNLHAGQKVSVERSAKFGDEIGGHQMAGHVFTTAKIINKEHKENNLLMQFKLTKDVMEFVFDKGFIGVDGSSLTVHDVDNDAATFIVNLIPHTMTVTNFINKNIGDEVNIELDANTLIIVNTVKNYLKANFKL
jgi:riboflavin synthase